MQSMTIMNLAKTNRIIKWVSIRCEPKPNNTNEHGNPLAFFFPNEYATLVLRKHPKFFFSI